MIGLCLPGHSELGVETLNRLTSETQCAFSCPSSYPNVHELSRKGNLWTEIPYFVDLNATSDDWVLQIQQSGETLDAFVCILNYRQRVPFELMTIETLEEHNRYNYNYPLQTLINLADSNRISYTAPIIFLAEISDEPRNFIPYSCSVNALRSSLNVMKKHNEYFHNMDVQFAAYRDREEYDRLTEEIVLATVPRSDNVS